MALNKKCGSFVLLLGFVLKFQLRILVEAQSSSAVVTCRNDGSNIEIRIRNVLDLAEWAGDEDDWRLNNNANCQPTFADPDVVYSSFNGSDCATLQSTADYFVYRFVVNAVKQENSPTQAYDHGYEIVCRYNRNGVVQSSFVGLHQLNVNAQGLNELRFTLSLYADNLLYLALPDPVPLGEDIVVQVKVSKILGVDLDILLNRCFTSTDEQGIEGVHELITNSCNTGSDASVMYNCSEYTGHTEEFLFNAYRYPRQAESAKVWVHCEVYACLPDPSSLCQTQCDSACQSSPSKKRRNAGLMTDGTKYQLTSGPYRFVDTKRQNKQKDVNQADKGKDSRTPLSVIAVILSSICCFVFISVTCYIVCRRRGGIS